MSDERDLPEFLRESLVDDGDAAQNEPKLGEAVGLVSEIVEERQPSPEALGRLLTKVEAFPGRYLPFFDSLMEMYDLDEAALRRELERAGAPGAFKASGLPGVRVFTVSGGPRVKDAQTLLVRFAAGQRFPWHRHRSPERTLILEGGYADEHGRLYHPGDFDDRGTEAAHSFRALPDGLCIAASVHHGFDFEFWPLRMFARLLGH